MIDDSRQWKADLWVLPLTGDDRKPMPDGRFLMSTVLDEASAPITLLMNWHPEAKK
jgi:hypothetical protein